jgi:hypothetical protein
MDWKANVKLKANVIQKGVNLNKNKNKILK